MRERSCGDSCEPERARAKRTHSSLPPTADRTIAGYTPRSAEQTLLHRIVAEQLESFLARVRDTGQPAPRFIEQELRAYLRCGVLAHGFLRCTAMPASSIERFPAGGEARERGGEGERNAEHRAGANEGARCDHTPGSAAETASRTPAITGTPAKLSRRLAWAALLQRVFEVDALRCPDCGALGKGALMRTPTDFFDSTCQRNQT